MASDKKEQDILKVLKDNQVKSKDALAKAKAAREKASASVSDTDDFISDMERRLGADSKGAVSEHKHTPSEGIIPEEKSWDELVSEASEAYPDDVSIYDILTVEEYNKAMAELESYYEEFSHRTRLTKTDWIFLTTAIALQCVRQYVIDPWIKKLRKNAGRNDEKGRKGNAEPGWYHADTDKILTGRVPFDAQGYSGNRTVDGFLKGGNHRYVTLGHDPMLGWIFGTANILTNTVTRFDLLSAHVKNIDGKNTIYARADTKRVFSATAERFLHEKADGKIAVGCALIREGIHLKSDINTKKSLPLPGLQTISPKLAETLSRHGIDTASVGTEMTLSVLINVIIAMVHRLCFDESCDDKKLFEVRTRKIILYSNIIASTSNVIAASLTEKYDLLDVGGMINTIIGLFSNIRFIADVKQEFVQSKLDERFRGIADETEKLYNQLIVKG